MRTRNRIALAVVAVLVAALVAWALRPQPIAVEVAEVTRGPFEQTVVDDGKTRVRDRYVVSAPLAGRVERIVLDAGDTVRQGQVVGRFRVGEVSEAQVAHLISHGTLDDYVDTGSGIPDDRRKIGSTSSKEAVDAMAVGGPTTGSDS